MNNLEQLEQSVIQWAEDKQIFTKATPYKQAQKTLEECGELLLAIGKQEFSDSKQQHENAYNEVKDSVGDIAVTIIIQAAMQGTSLTECLQSAYDVIKNRTGSVINGQFVKDK